MQYNLTPYTRAIEPFAWIDDVFTEQELNWLQHKAQKAEEKAYIGGGAGLSTVNTNIRRSNVTWLNNTPDTQWVFEKLAEAVSTLNAQFYNFDLVGFGEALQLTNYDQAEKGMYGWHQDYGGKISRKLSLVVQLTDPSMYEGGNLQILTTGEPATVRKQRGLVCVFPSYTLHQVTPVTAGTRQSLVAWVSGPAFK
jgi:PKHD-type hydroxylase